MSYIYTTHNSILFIYATIYVSLYFTDIDDDAYFTRYSTSQFKGITTMYIFCISRAASFIIDGDKMETG